MNFKVEQIDHIHVYVADRYEAARWYKAVLGLEILPEHEHWAAENGGPLTISSDGGNTSLALFEKGSDETVNRSTVAFRVKGEDFLAFLEELEKATLYDRRGNRLTKSAVVDHDKAFSVYFCDADKNPIELTTYDYERVAGQLRAR